MIRRPELLSPAGNWECLRAAVANRADAIYFGLERFNARMRADNFHVEELPEIVELLVDGLQKDLGDKRFLLSPQDLAGIDEIPELIRLGVACFKIEGRLKSPEYVAAVTRVYRNAIDRAVDALSSEAEVATTPAKDRYSLEMTFSRGLSSGWLHGVNHQRLVNGRCGKKRGSFVGFVRRVGKDFVELDPEVQLAPGDGIVFDTGGDTEHEQGGRIYEIRSRRLYFRSGQIDFQRVKTGHRLWKTDDPALNRQLRQPFARDPEPARTPVDMEVSGRDGAPLKLRVISGNHAAEADSELKLTPAKTSSLTV
jgi:U32 family peptidase